MKTLLAVIGFGLANLALPGTSLASTSPPTISGFSPKSGPVGTLVTITGKHFGAPGLQVSFGGTLGAPETVSATQILIRVPPLAPTGKVQVKTRYGTAVSASSFRLTRGIASFPKGAWPGESITIAGSGFAAGHDLILKLDGASIGGVGTDAHGNFSAIRALPSDLTIGPEHIMSAFDTISHVQPTIRISIFGSWPQPRDDAAQSSDGAAEFLINTSNVQHIKFRYAVGPFNSPVVEDDGHVYGGISNDGVGELNPWGAWLPPIDWGATTDGTVSQAPAVVNGVVYAVTSDTLYAFAEHPSGAINPLWTALLGDAANPYAPVVADGRVFVADGGTGVLQVFDANGVTNCSGTPTVCTPLWFNAFTSVFGPPAIDAKSAGGTGDVYLSVRNGGVNKVVVRSGAGVTVGSSISLATTSLSGPSLAGTHVMVSGWSSGTATATLYALLASTQAVDWSSGNLGGSAAPTAVAVGGGRTYVQNSDGTLSAFKNGGCSASVCSALWSSFDYGAGGSTPPTYANGVVYAAAGSGGFPGLLQIWAFDASGCGGPTGCGEIGAPTYVGTNSQITVVAATIFGQGANNLSVAY